MRAPLKYKYELKSSFSYYFLKPRLKKVDLVFVQETV